MIRRSRVRILPSLLMHKPILSSLNDEVEERFWSYVFIKDNDQCWEWIGGGIRYGNFCIKRGDVFKAHRVSWVIANRREIPDEVFVCHSCDNGICVNPLHLFLGTPKDNTRDSMQKGRGIIGEKNGNAKLSEIDVENIRRILDIGLTQKSISDKYNVDPSTISLINSGKSWNY